MTVKHSEYSANKKNRIKNVGAGDKIFVGFIYIFIFMLFIIISYPMLYVLSASVSDPNKVVSGEMVLWPVGFTLDGYKYVFSYSDIWIGYGNTLFYTVFGTFIKLLALLPCAYALSRKDMAGRSFILRLFVITMYFSGGLVPTYLNFQEFGLINTRTIILISGLVAAYYVIVCRTFFISTVPDALQESARIDGCNDFRIFYSIVLPLSKPLIVVMSLFIAVDHWNSYFSAMIFLKDRNLYPLQLFLREILVRSQIDPLAFEGASADAIQVMIKQANTANLLKYAIIVVSTIPMMVVYPFLQKFFAKGILIGSLKG